MSSSRTKGLNLTNYFTQFSRIIPVKNVVKFGKFFAKFFNYKRLEFFPHLHTHFAKDPFLNYV